MGRNVDRLAVTLIEKYSDELLRIPGEFDRPALEQAVRTNCPSTVTLLCSRLAVKGFLETNESLLASLQEGNAAAACLLPFVHGEALCAAHPTSLRTAVHSFCEKVSPYCDPAPVTHMLSRLPEEELYRQDARGMTPLHEARNSVIINALVQLLPQHALGIVDEKGATPLCRLVTYRYQRESWKAALEVLVSSMTREQLSARDGSGRTAADYAERQQLSYLFATNVKNAVL